MADDLRIDIDRLRAEMTALGEIGRIDGAPGISRSGYSDADMAAREFMAERMARLGLIVSRDAVGNVSGLWLTGNGPSVMLGSHLDTVPMGGFFDGALGVCAAMECVRVLKEARIAPAAPIEVIATAEEEGRFGGMLGAQALTGNLTMDWLERARDRSGELLRDAMARQQFQYWQAMDAARDPDQLVGFLELHIEQGPVLEAEQKNIGVVEGISGVFKWLVKLIGKASHAGTAPMNLRSDAFMGVADFAHEISRIIDEEGTDKSRLTIGSVELKPGFAHTVPGQAEFTIVGRDMSEQVMTALADSCRKVLSSIARKHKLMFEYEQMSWLAPRHCSPEMMALLEKHSNALGYKTIVMPSGAGHDSQFFTDITPTGLLFIPSVGGISHAPDEWSHWHDVEKGCNVLLNAVLELAAE